LPFIPVEPPPTRRRRAMEKTQEKPKTATWIPVALVKSESSDRY